MLLYCTSRLPVDLTSFTRGVSKPPLVIQIGGYDPVSDRGHSWLPSIERLMGGV
ncbi:uncharacterized protein BO95DRAFT_442247 [Aspergillus brunneoviolaceus CBS 621.78]|uniref:Uncharacterized protein n=1 Tax=Aspergillus brunneoviolaceus CBS 621.78 TaxID=1450534 RepID=A0ACD1GAY5_9EURO|nr:hypothetical protein BO95DRAFT_442247 [Aspergillus brunneoviolaceus CBS 621.78]RAH46375.1 hypothetical protein BO95DRAFT_442247 [Aspergillus brunneoviolaceus CBS 621.78]